MGPSKPGLSDTTRPFSGNTYRFKLRVVNVLCTWQGAWHLVGVLQVEFLLPFDSTDYPFPPSHIHQAGWAPRLLLAHSGLHRPLKAPLFMSPASHSPAYAACWHLSGWFHLPVMFSGRGSPGGTTTAVRREGPWCPQMPGWCLGTAAF